MSDRRAEPTDVADVVGVGCEEESEESEDERLGLAVAEAKFDEVLDTIDERDTDGDPEIDIDVFPVEEVEPDAEMDGECDCDTSAVEENEVRAEADAIDAEAEKEVRLLPVVTDDQLTVALGATEAREDIDKPRVPVTESVIISVVDTLKEIAGDADCPVVDETVAVIDAALAL